MGSYEENKEKFPHGIKNLSDAVHAAGMKFGLWVDPGNVDAARVESGEIPSDWLAMIDGKTIGALHPSLAPTKQLCLGDPKVVAWVETQLGDIIEKWSLDWIKWDPSATVSYAVQPHRSRSRQNGWRLCGVSRAIGDTSLSAPSLSQPLRL